MTGGEGWAAALWRHVWSVTRLACWCPRSSPPLRADIKVREPNYDALVATGKLAYHPPRFMTVNEAAEQLMEVEARRKEGGE